MKRNYPKQLVLLDNKTTTTNAKNYKSYFAVYDSKVKNKNRIQLNYIYKDLQQPLLRTAIKREFDKYLNSDRSICVVDVCGKKTYVEYQAIIDNEQEISRDSILTILNCHQT